MKKLLSLLSVLTISSSAIPTTIAASPYQKENNNNNLRETMESDSNNKKEKNNKIILKYKNKNTIGKNVYILGKTITKTTNKIKDYIEINSNKNKKTRAIDTQYPELTQSSLCTKPTLTTFTAGGAGLGGSIGSILPGAGTIIGIGIGGIIGFLSGLGAGKNLCPLVPKKQ